MTVQLEDGTVASNLDVFAQVGAHTAMIGALSKRGVELGQGPKAGKCGFSEVLDTHRLNSG